MRPAKSDREAVATNQNVDDVAILEVDNAFVNGKNLLWR
jgi:hypothetical protein